MRSRSGSRIVTVVLAVLATGCGDDATPTPIGLANPASVYCEEQGGTLEIVDETAGQVGYCNLPDGSRIEEWELYRSGTTEP